MNHYLVNFYRYSGAEFIFRKFFPKDRNELPSGIIWIIGIYVALFGIASNNYENKVDVLEGRASAVMTLLSSDRKVAIEQLISLQQAIVPSLPEFLKPHTTLKTMFGEGGIHLDTINNIKTVVEALKSDLREANLDEINLSEADLSESNLNKASMRNANLRNVDFSNSVLTNMDFNGAQINGAIFFGANLSGSTNITTAMLSTALIDTKTTIPSITAYPDKIRPVEIFERLTKEVESDLKAFIFRAERRFYIWIGGLHGYNEDEINISINGKKWTAFILMTTYTADLLSSHIHCLGKLKFPEGQYLMSFIQISSGN